MSYRKLKAGRYAKIDGFEGTRNRADSNDWSDPAEVGYYYVEYQQQGIEYFPRVIGSSDKPSSPEYKNLRSAVVDFSGFTIKIGMKTGLW